MVQARDKCATCRFMRSVLFLSSLCGVLIEWFLNGETNMGPVGSVTRAVLYLCSLCGLVAEWFSRRPNLRLPGE